MNPADYIIIAVIVCIVAVSIIYLYRAKKHGASCIGCPNSKQCAKQNSSKNSAQGSGCGACGCDRGPDRHK